MPNQVSDYEYHSTPFAHQHEGFMLCRDEIAFALLMEQGTGKSKIAIDKTAYLYNKGKVGALLVIAPNGVHENWILNEIPKHLPPYIERDIAYYVGSGSTSAERKALANLARMDRPALKVLAINFEAMSTAKGCEFVHNFIRVFRTIGVVDESTGMKNHKSKRTVAIGGLRPLLPYRMILTGTPVTEGPEDIFAPFEFLDPYFLPCSSYYAHTARYCELVSDPASLVGLRPFEVKQVMALRNIRSTPRGRMAQLPARDEDGKKQYKNLDELQRIIAKHSFRVTKDQCLDLPPKLFTKIYVRLSDNQKRIYANLTHERMAEHEGMEMTAAVAMTRMIRHQQVIGGFFAPDPVEELDAEDNVVVIRRGATLTVAIDPKNNRIEALIEFLENHPGKAIIWARFKSELKAITKALDEHFGKDSSCELHGDIKSSDRQESNRKFQEEALPRYAVANPAAKGVSRGQTMTMASTVVYYSNTFSLEDRLQSEDRAHRIGLVHPVLYADMVALDTIDEKIIDALRNKKDVADMITGDAIRGWI